MPSPSPVPSATASRPGLVSVDGRTFPLRSARIEARAGGGLASTTLVQEYGNPWPEPLEVLYTLPLPADGAVLGYDIRLGERTITGVIERREDAREKYVEALLHGRTAGLLEQERADTFTLTLGNLPPGATARVEVRMMHRLAFRPGTAEGAPEWEYRFPTVVGVRYQGAPGRVPDAEALDPDRADSSGTPTRLDLDLVLEDGDATAIVPRSPNHELNLAAADGTYRVALASLERLDRDVVVRWRAATGAIGARLVEGPGLPGDDGRYGLLTLTPPVHPQTTFARDVTILLDASGSMTGPPIEQAKVIATTLLHSLTAGDRFEVLAFSNDVTRLTRGVIEATPKAIERVAESLRALEAGGATEMANAVERALDPLREGSQRQVVLITDGQIGFESEIVRKLMTQLPAGARLHVAGVGMAPNRTLTRAASRAGRGVEVIVGTREDATGAAAILRQATAAPVLTEIVIEGTAVVAVAPERPGDVFAGRPALVTLELRPEGGTIEVHGKQSGQDEHWHERIVVAPRETSPEAGPALGALFGRERVEDQEMRVAALGSPREQRALLQTIEQIGLRHRITTSRTSLVAISEDPTVDPSDPRRRQRLAIELPADVSAEGFGLLDARSYASRVAPQSFARQRLGSVRGWMSGIAREESVGFHESRSDDTRTTRGRILGYHEGLLLLEFEVPAGGIDLPADGERVRVFTGDLVAATVVGSKSTRPGRHAHGLTVRLALQLDDSPTLDDVTSLHLRSERLSLEIDLR